LKIFFFFKKKFRSQLLKKLLLIGILRAKDIDMKKRKLNIIIHPKAPTAASFLKSNLLSFNK